MDTNSHSSTLSSDLFKSEPQRKSVWQFAIKLLLLFGLFLLPVAILEVFLFRLGETVPYSIIAGWQMSGEHFVYYRAFTDTNFGYKAEFIRRQHADVITFGDSRVGQFRAGMFEPYNFYNMGNTAYYLKDFARASSEFPADFRPRAIIVGIGFWMFDEHNQEKSLLETEDIAQTIGGRILIYRGALENLSSLTVAPVTPIARTPAQGLLAIRKGLGFREDGSIRYGFRGSYLGGIFRKKYKELIEKAMRAIDGGPNDAIWGPGEHVGKTWPYLENFIRFWRNRGTTVIILNMPIDTNLDNKWRESPRYSVYREYNHLDLGNGIRGLGALYFDFSNPESYGSNNNEMTDGIHAGEAGSIRMWLKMLEDPKIHALFPNIDKSRLKKLADGPEKFDIFGDAYVPIPDELREQL
jgi:hypothetical protein